MSTVAVLFLLVALVSSVSCQAQCPDQMNADVLILGAGMAGLGAAERLSQRGIDNFLIIEQADKVGGRVQSAEFGGGNVELGPQWLFNADLDPEDMRHPLYEYVNRCNITLRDLPFGFLGFRNYNRTGHDISEEVSRLQADFNAAMAPDVVRSIIRALPEDEELTLSQGLRIAGWNPQTILEEHVDYLSADALFSFPSAQASYRFTVDPDYIQPRVTAFANIPVIRTVIDRRGFFAIPKCIADRFLAENDPRLILETPIVEIESSDDCVCANTRSGDRYCAPYAIVTFSAGVLQNSMKFTPALPMIKNITVNQLEMGHFLKIYLAFEETFWDTDVDLITYADELRGREYYPFFITWGAHFPEPTNVLEAVVFGIDESRRIALQDPEITRIEIYEVLRNIYGERASAPIDIIVADYIANPYFYGNIFVASVGIGPRQVDEMNTPCGNMYFSGDYATLMQRSLAHGSLLHGRETADRIGEILQGPLDIDFINDTPLVEGNMISVQFRTSKRANSIECIIPTAGIRMDCMSGQFTVSDLADGIYSLRVVARAGTERAIVRRILTINTGDTACHAHLLSDVSVTGGRATMEFSSSGLPASGFLCSLDNAPLESCDLHFLTQTWSLKTGLTVASQSPLLLRELSPGRHRVRIDPVCAGESTRVVTQFDIEE